MRKLTIVSVPLLILALVVGAISFSSCGDTWVEMQDRKQVGSWFYTLHRVKRGNDYVEIEISIKNKSTQPLVYDAGSVNISYPTLICTDAYDQRFIPEDDSWYQMRKIYPDETVKGKLRYQLHGMSGDLRLYLGAAYPLFVAPDPRVFLFDLQEKTPTLSPERPVIEGTAGALKVTIDECCTWTDVGYPGQRDLDEIYLDLTLENKGSSRLLGKSFDAHTSPKVKHGGGVNFILLADVLPGQKESNCYAVFYAELDTAYTFHIYAQDLAGNEYTVDIELPLGNTIPECE